jgi:hypothetical protein
LPSSITHLTFGKFFNQEVNKLPSSITHLTFGDEFSQKVEKLPKELKKIKCSKIYKYLKDFDSRSSDRNLASLENYEVETF